MPFIKFDQRRQKYLCREIVFDRLRIGPLCLHKLEELGVLKPVRMRFIDSDMARDEIVYDIASVRKAKRIMREKYRARYPRLARPRRDHPRDPVASS